MSFAAVRIALESFLIAGRQNDLAMMLSTIPARVDEALSNS